jgi:hypothetical protein
MERTTILPRQLRLARKSSDDDSGRGGVLRESGGTGGARAPKK